MEEEEEESHFNLHTLCAKLVYTPLCSQLFQFVSGS